MIGIRMILVLALSLLAFSSPVEAQLSDTTPPQLQTLSFSPTSIDTTAGPETVVVTLGINDDLSGTRMAVFHFASPSGQWRQGSAGLITGTLLSGTYEASIVFGELGESGTWHLDQLQLWDNAGNFETWRTDTLAAAGFPTDLQVISLEDVAPPEVIGISFDPAAVDVSSADATIMLTLDLADAPAGVALGETSYGSSWTLQLESPSRSQIRLLFSREMTRTAGTNELGTWTGTFVMPRYSEPGVWRIRELRLNDQVLNVAVLVGAHLDADGLTATVEVASTPADTTPPQLLNLSFYPSVIDASAGPQTVTVEVAAADDLSGVDLSPDGPYGPSLYYGAFFRSPSGGQYTAAGSYPALQLIAGSSANGTWTGTASFPQFAEAGTWKIQFVQLKDRVRNLKNSSTSELVAAGLPTDLIVLRPSLSLDGTLEPSGGTVSDTTFGGRAQVTAPPGVLAAPTDIAIDVFSSPLQIPTPTGYVGVGTYYVNIHLTPQPAMPLPAPGLTIVLPLADPLVPGQTIDLYRIDPATGALVPALDAYGTPVTGSVNADGMSATFHGIAQLSTVVGLIPEVIEVAIDVKPGDAIAAINSRSKGTTPVAILSTLAFDAVGIVEVEHLTFGRTGDEESLSFCNEKGEDVNRDGILDLVCHFRTGLTGLAPGDSQVVLRGRTTANEQLEGSDLIVVVK